MPGTIDPLEPYSILSRLSIVDAKFAYRASLVTAFVVDAANDDDKSWPNGFLCLIWKPHSMDNGLDNRVNGDDVRDESRGQVIDPHMLQGLTVRLQYSDVSLLIVCSSITVNSDFICDGNFMTDLLTTGPISMSMQLYTLAMKAIVLTFRNNLRRYNLIS
ncbi:hypothetical protein GQX74_000337 [Glossina fuscipes]|nr:hypothetical protein GQX74_000337 [Glossina fuscipes]